MLHRLFSLELDRDRAPALSALEKIVQPAVKMKYGAAHAAIIK
jgi:hypothetical protein